jgi:AraC-like DNA-binding protein
MTDWNSPDGNYQHVSLQSFITQYMQGEAEPYGSPTRPLQVFPLHMATTLMRPPTPLFRTRYNFLLLFAAGGGRQQVDNETIQLTANDVLFIREGHLNAILEIDPATQGYFIYLDNTLLPTVLDDKVLLHRFSFHPRNPVPPEVMEWLSTCCELLIGQPSDQTHLQDIQTSLLRAMLMRIADAAPAELIRPDRPSEVTMRFRELVYEHSHLHREVAFYAERLSVTQNYLNRCVKQVTGKSPKQHITEMVIQTGRAMLLDRSKTVAEVAYALNFTDAAYFGRLFRKLTGQTPTDYRAGLMHDLSGNA